jgi:hypothetical protein
MRAAKTVKAATESFRNWQDFVFIDWAFIRDLLLVWVDSGFMSGFENWDHLLNLPGLKRMLFVGFVERLHPGKRESSLRTTTGGE